MSTLLQNPAPPHRASHRVNSLEEALNGITQALEQDLFAEEVSHRQGLFQSLDARVKVISVLAFLISVSLSRSLAVIASVYLIVLVLALLSAVPADVLVKRVWLALPFFTGLIVVPALFLTPGPPLLQVLPGLAITRSGVTTALFLLARVSTSVSLTLLLVLTTPWNTVLSALTVLRVPEVVVLILGMTYRYIYLLLHAANDMFLSRKSRMVGRLATSENQRMLAAIGGTLLGKSISLSNEVYLAMQSRGFRGSLVTLKPFKMRPADWAWLAILGTLSGAAILLGI
jgi:cobalt/nickel transport system permease protein